MLLVNNGSTDATAEVVQELLPSYPSVRVVTLQPNQGYGGGIIEGLRQANSDYIGWTHADLQTDLGDVSRAYDLLSRQGFAEDVFIKGHRRGRPLSDEVFTVGMSIFESLYLGAHLWDINAQPNIFSRSFFQSWSNPPTDFALDLYALYWAHQKRLRLVRFDVHFPPRRHGTSKWNTGLAAKKKFIQRTLSFSKTLKQGLAQCS